MSGSFLYLLVWLVEFQLIMKKVLALFQCFSPISAFYAHFSVSFLFQHFIPFSVLSPFQLRFIPISAAFYPHFGVLSPFQRFIPISAFYSHFSVLSPFQRFIPISVSASVSVSAIQFQRFISTLLLGADAKESFKGVN